MFFRFRVESLGLLVSLLALAGVYLEPSVFAEALRPILVDELGVAAIVEERERAEFVVVVSEVGGELALTVSSTAGAVILDRRIGLVANRTPALRAAALAIEEALAVKPAHVAPAVVSSAAPEPVPRVEARAERLGLAFHVGGGALVAPSVIPSFEAGAAFDVGGVELGLRFAASFGAGQTTTFADGTPALSARLRMFEFLAIADWIIADTNLVELGAHAAIGAASLSMTADPLGFEGEAPERTETNAAFTARFGALARAPFGDTLRGALGAGVALHAPAVRADLPAGFPKGDASLNSGFASIYLLAAIDFLPF
jgi:hypothetical protein